MLKAKYFILLICFSFLLKTEAKVTLTSIWGDNMVLQQQSEVTFSGTATLGKRVQATASWNNKKIQTNVDAKGEWKLSLQMEVRVTFASVFRRNEKHINNIKYLAFNI